MINRANTDTPELLTKRPGKTPGERPGHRANHYPREPLYDAFVAKYPKYGRIIELFGEANDCEPSWENITKVRLAKFVDYLRERIAPSSAKTYCAMLKAVLSLYSDEIELPADYARILSVKGCIAQNTWLSDKEIMRLWDTPVYNCNEKAVKYQFVLGCLTGARHSDYSRFTEANITGERLVYVSQKTHVKTEIPLSPLARHIISLQEVTTRKLSDVSFNAILRKLCKRAGISEHVRLFKAGIDVDGEKWEFVSSHTARRSFATNVYLNCRDIFLVSRMLGHSSIDMTAKYICTTDIPENLRNYFLNFENSGF